MSGMKFFLSGMMMALLGLGVVNAQEYSSGRGSGNPPPLAKDPNTVSPNAPGLGTPGAINEMEPAPPGPSSWISYVRSPGCCGPLGCDGPISGEVYFRTGVSNPISGNFFGRLLDSGWQVDGGARSIFYNAARTSGWTVDLGMTSIQNSSSTLINQVVLYNVKTSNALSSVPVVPIAVKHVHRTFANLALGKEWYLWGSGDKDAPGCNWRTGIDVGGRYGTTKVEINKLQIDNAHIPHLTDTIGGMLVAWHTDIMVPFGPGFFIAGFRAEWSYTWSDVLQVQNQADIMDINILGTLGFQF